MKKYLEQPVTRFLVIGSSLYLLWIILYYLVIKEFTNWDFYLDYSIVFVSEKIFELFGIGAYTVIESDHVILMLERTVNSGVWVGDECNGFKLFSIFSIFVIAFPGDWRKKLWFIPLGLVLIHFANILRVNALLLIYESNPAALDFNHNYTFTVLVYSIIFVLWWWWAKKYGRVAKS